MTLQHRLHARFPVVDVHTVIDFVHFLSERRITGLNGSFDCQITFSGDATIFDCTFLRHFLFLSVEPVPGTAEQVPNGVDVFGGG